MMKTYRGYIKELKENEVFVFGSNLNGFHGAGSAGYASFGESGNVWRKYDYHKKPNGWKGKWNIKGVSEGYQEGDAGSSYAIPTVSFPGKKTSIPKLKILKSVIKLYDFASNNKDKKFYIAYKGNNNYNGYSAYDLCSIFTMLGIPSNIYFNQTFYKNFLSLFTIQKL
jgi:hypothetical protein